MQDQFTRAGRDDQPLPLRALKRYRSTSWADLPFNVAGSVIFISGSAMALRGSMPGRCPAKPGPGFVRFLGEFRQLADAENEWV